MLNSMSQFREIYMQDFFRSNSNPISREIEDRNFTESVDKSFIEVLFKFK